MSESGPIARDLETGNRLRSTLNSLILSHLYRGRRENCMAQITIYSDYPSSFSPSPFPPSFSFSCPFGRMEHDITAGPVSCVCAVKRMIAITGCAVRLYTSSTRYSLGLDQSRQQRSGQFSCAILSGLQPPLCPAAAAALSKPRTPK